MLHRVLPLIGLLLAATVVAACSMTFNLAGEMAGANGEVSHGQETKPTENSGLESF